MPGSSPAPAASAPAPFAFLIDGPPVSAQARRKARKHQWTADVRRAASAAWPAGVPPHVGPVAVEILYLHDPPDPAGSPPLDADNLAKPVLDGLKGVAYADDAVVLELVVQKRDRGTSPVSAAVRALYDARIGRGPEFLHVAVRPLPDPSVIP